MHTKAKAVCHFFLIGSYWLSFNIEKTNSLGSFFSRNEHESQSTLYLNNLTNEPKMYLLHLIMYFFDLC